MKIALIVTKREDMRKTYTKDWVDRAVYDDIIAVEKSLHELGHTVVKYIADLDLFDNLISNKPSIDLVFNLCDDGFFADSQLEPHLPAVLDVLGILYTGSGYLTLALCLNKLRAKELFIANRLPTPKFQIFESENDKLKNNFKFPLIVKPVHEDASIGIKDESVVNNESELRKRIRVVIKEYNQPALVEEFIDGREFYVGILGDKQKEALPVAELVFGDFPEKKPRIFSYSAKWDEKSIEFNETEESCPANIDKELEKKLIGLALQASKILLCRDYVRIDFRVDKNGNPFILEVNPNPDLSPEDWLALMAKEKGYSYTELINRIIKSALQRKNKMAK